MFHPTESDIKILCRHETSTFIRQLSIADDDLGSMSLIGGEVGQIGGGKKIPADFVWPSGIAGDSTGNIFISDEGNHTITHISPDGDLISRWGKFGNEQHEINRPAGIFLDSNDNVFLTDALNYSVKVFSNNGEFIKSWGVKGETSGKFNLPWGMIGMVTFMYQIGVIIEFSCLIIKEDLLKNSVVMLHCQNKLEIT